MPKLAAFDSNIIIDHLRNEPRATELILQYSNRIISAMTWMEVMVYVIDTEQEQDVRQTLARFRKIDITSAIEERAVRARKNQRLKLPDAIIYVTAQEHDAILFTRDAKDFPPDPRVVVPYQP